MRNGQFRCTRPLRLSRRETPLPEAILEGAITFNPRQTYRSVTFPASFTPRFSGHIPNRAWQVLEVASFLADRCFRDVFLAQVLKKIVGKDEKVTWDLWEEKGEPKYYDHFRKDICELTPLIRALRALPRISSICPSPPPTQMRPASPHPSHVQ